MDSVIVVALVVVFSLGLIVGTRSQQSCSHQQDSLNELRNLVLLIDELRRSKPQKTNKQQKTK